MKNCIKCGELLSKNATFCPKCHTIQPKKNNVPLIILIVICGLIFLGVMGSILGEDDNSSSNSNIPTSSSNNKSNENEKTEEKKDFSQNEVVIHKNIKYSILKVEKTQGSNPYVKPSSGNEYVKVTIQIENNSNEKISYNALDWQMVNEDGVEDAWGTFTADDDKNLSTGELDPNGKVSGVLVWEQKKGDSNLRLRYYDNLLKKDYTFQFKLD